MMGVPISDKQAFVVIMIILIFVESIGVGLGILMGYLLWG